MTVDEAATVFLKALRQQDPGSERSVGDVAAAVATAFPDTVPLLEGEYEAEGERHAKDLEEQMERAKEEGRKAARRESPPEGRHAYLDGSDSQAGAGHSYL